MKTIIQKILKLSTQIQNKKKIKNINMYEIYLMKGIIKYIFVFKKKLKWI